MSFEEAYGYYAHDDPSSFQAGSSMGGGFYYPLGMTSYGPQVGTSHGPQVGPSSSAWFGYENLIMRSIMDLSTQISNLSLRQQEMNTNLEHNFDLTQQTWGMTSSLQYDVSHMYQHYPQQEYPDQEED